jgi:hypothetical protein
MDPSNERYVGSKEAVELCIQGQRFLFLFLYKKIEISLIKRKPKLQEIKEIKQPQEQKYKTSHNTETKYKTFCMDCHS